jgi:hypothetical protein
MPIDFQRDDRRRLITVTIIEPFSFDELLDQIDRQWAEGAWEYAVLYDGRTNEHVSPPSELQRLVERVQVVGGARPRGPVGVAIPQKPEMLRGGLQLGAQSGRPGDIEVLLTGQQLEAWLARHAPRRSTEGDEDQ